MQGIIATVIVAVMIIFLIIDRKKIVVHGLFPILYFALYKTRLGLNSMEWMAQKIPRILKTLGIAGIIAGFLGLIFISVELIRTTISILTQQSSMPGIMPVLPVKASGIFYVPPLYFLISIFVIAIVHEYGHGVIARARNVPILSSGFAFVGLIIPIIPAAFVEPDEKKLSHRNITTKLSVFAAGPFFNILLSVLLILLLGFELPGLIPESVTSTTSIYNLGGTASEIVILKELVVKTVAQNSPAEKGGITAGERIISINDESVSSKELPEVITKLKPGDEVRIKTTEKEHIIKAGEHPAEKTRGWLGLSFDVTTGFSDKALAKYGELGSTIIVFLAEQIYWIIILSIGIGLFNLLPLGPLDGGRMLKVILEIITPEKAAAWHNKISIIFLLIIATNILAGFL